jgi:protein-disulfide isomerase
MTPVESDEDLTRKQRREAARAERKQVEEAQAASAARRRRLMQLGAVGAAVVVVIVIVLIAAGGGGSKAVRSGTPQATKLTSEVTSLVGGVPQNGNAIGNPNAPVTIQYFGDLQCPVCREFTLGALPSIVSHWVREGKVRIEYRSLETATHEPETFRLQQVAALAAGKQKKLWDYIELFYHQQGEEDTGYVTEGFLQNLARQTSGLNLSQWQSERTNSALSDQVTTDEQAANTAGFTGTPSFLIGKTGGKAQKLEYSSLTDPSSFNEAIEKTLKS